MPESQDFQTLYERFDRLIDLPLAEQQSELETLKKSGDPLALQLEGMLMVHQHQNATESIFSVEELVRTIKAQVPGGIVSDLRELAGRLHWDPVSRCFQLGHFSLLGCLSVSALGATYQAHDLALERDVVLLLLFPRWSEAREVQQRSLEASRAVARIFDPHVAAILGTVNLEGIFAVVRQWIPGQSLEQYLASGHVLSLEETRYIGHGVASGLQTIHDERVLHGDLKPANILLRTGTLHPVITDFGTATWIPANKSAPWHGGTQGFIAPEILRGEPPSPQSDLYSLGVLLQWMATGVLESTDEDWVQARERWLGPEPEIETLDRFQAFRQLVSKLLDPVPTQRPIDARSVATLLDQDSRIELRPRSLSERSHGGARPLLWDRPRQRREWLGHAVGLGLTATVATWGGRLLGENTNTNKTETLFIPGTEPNTRSDIYLAPSSEISFLQVVPGTSSTGSTEEIQPSLLRPRQPGEWVWLTSQVSEIPPMRFEVGIIRFDLRFDVDPGQALYRLEVLLGTEGKKWLPLHEGTNLFGGPYFFSFETHLGSKLLTGVRSIQIKLGMMFRQPARYPNAGSPIALTIRTDTPPYRSGYMNLWEHLDSRGAIQRR